MIGAGSKARAGRLPRVVRTTPSNGIVSACFRSMGDFHLPTVPQMNDSLEARLQAALNMVPAHTWYATPSGGLIFVNARSADYGGLPPDHALRLGIDTNPAWDSHITWLHPDDHDETRRAWAHCLRLSQPYAPGKLRLIVSTTRATPTTLEVADSARSRCWSVSTWPVRYTTRPYVCTRNEVELRNDGYCDNCARTCALIASSPGEPGNLGPPDTAQPELKPTRTAPITAEEIILTLLMS